MYICQTNYILLCFAEIPFNFIWEKISCKIHDMQKVSLQTRREKGKLKFMQIPIKFIIFALKSRMNLEIEF